jgi:hypothetical protein
MSLGTDRVRVAFNPSKENMVDKIKWKTSELIDLCNQQQDGLRTETARCWQLAMTHYEDAAMWAVKAATAEKPKSQAVPDYPSNHPVKGDLGSVPS